MSMGCNSRDSKTLINPFVKGQLQLQNQTVTREKATILTSPLNNIAKAMEEGRVLVDAAQIWPHQR